MLNPIRMRYFERDSRTRYRGLDEVIIMSEPLLEEETIIEEEVIDEVIIDNPLLEDAPEAIIIEPAAENS